MTVRFDMDTDNEDEAGVSDSEGEGDSSDSESGPKPLPRPDPLPDSERTEQDSESERQTGLAFPIQNVLDAFHPANVHKLVSGGKKGTGFALPLGVLGNLNAPEARAERPLQLLTRNLYIYLKETYAHLFDEVI